MKPLHEKETNYKYHNANNTFLKFQNLSKKIWIVKQLMQIIKPRTI